MLTKLSDWFNRISNGKVTLACMVIFLLFSSIVLPDQSSKAELYSGDAGSPDTSFIYTSADLYRIAAVYGVEGRQAYVYARFTFDLIWPLVYLSFLTTVISWLFHRARLPGSLWKRLNLIPTAGVLLDLGENISAAVVMARYPDSSNFFAVIAPFFTFLKWVVMGLCFVIIAAGVLAILWHWISRNNQP